MQQRQDQAVVTVAAFFERLHARQQGCNLPVEHGDQVAIALAVFCPFLQLEFLVGLGALQRQLARGEVGRAFQFRHQSDQAPRDGRLGRHEVAALNGGGFPAPADRRDDGQESEQRDGEKEEAAA